MKRQVQQTGIRKYFGADLVELQGEPLKVLDSLFSEYGPCVIQGCEPSAAEDGTYDIAPGLVALRTADPEGAERVMAMPFGGARGVSLPVWLVAEDSVQERVYGDGKVKPVAHSYSAVVTASEPAGGVSSLQITTQGAPRLVDALQDAAHRFVSDADKAKWDARVSAAQLAEALTGKADTSPAMITVNGGVNAIPYSLPHLAKMLVAGVQYASVLNMPDGRDSSNQMKIVGQPDQEDIAFRTQEHGQWRSLWHSGNSNTSSSDWACSVLRAAEGIRIPTKKGINLEADNVNQADQTPNYGFFTANPSEYGSHGDITSDYACYLTMGGYSDSTHNHRGWIFRNGTLNKNVASVSNSGVATFSQVKVGDKPVWHSGNFDPAECLKSTYQNSGSIDNLKGGMTFDYNSGGAGISGPLISFGGMSGRYDCQIAGEYVDGNNLKFRIRNGDRETWNNWREFWHSGNLTPPPAIHWAQITESDTPYRTSGDWIEYVQWRSNGFGMVCHIKPKVPVNSHAVQATILQTGGNTPSGLNVEVYDEIYNGEITVMLANANGAPVKGRFAIQVLGA